MNRKKKTQVVIIVAALFLCGILYLAFGPGSGRAETADDGVFVAGGASGTSGGESVTDGDSKPDSFSGVTSGRNNDNSVSEGNGQSSAVDASDAADGIGADDAETDGDVYIYICGAVKHPGVYTFDHSPRIVEVVEQAGGFTKKADQSSVNLAGQLEDGAQIVVYERNKDGTSAVISSQNGGASIESGVSGSSGVSTGDSRVNINTAGLEELKTIPGIGDVKAVAIVSYRDENGRFGKIEDLMNISGIKQGTFDKIKEYVTV